MVPGLFDVRHHFEIDSLGDDRSRLRQFEHFSGFAALVLLNSVLLTRLTNGIANAAGRDERRQPCLHVL